MQGFQQAVSQNPARLGSGDAAKALYVGNLHPFVTDAMLQVRASSHSLCKATLHPIFAQLHCC